MNNKCASHRYSKEVCAAADKMGQFYLEKNGGNYDAAADEIMRLQFTDLQVTDSSIIISTARPGRLIGVKGKNIEALEKALGIKIKIVESQSINDLITPFEPIEDFYGE